MADNTFLNALSSLFNKDATPSNAGFNPLAPSQAPMQQANVAQAPAVQPLPVQPLPVQPLPQVSAPVQPQQPQMPQQPQVAKMAENIEGIDAKSKAQLGAVNAREQKLFDEQIAYTKEKAASESKAKGEIEAEFGTAEGRAKEQMLKTQQIQDQMTKEMADVDAQIERLKAVEFKNFWADKGTEQKIAAAIAVGLGAIGAGLSGTGQNVGLQMLNRAMDDDFKIQEANYNKALKQIELSRLNVDQKNKLIDNLEKQRLIYNAAQSDAVIATAEKYMKEKGLTLNPQAQEALMKLQMAKESAAKDLILRRADKVQQQFSVQQSAMAPKDWLAEASNEKSVLGGYNKAIDEYNKVQSFKKSGNYNASVINLIASGLQQGSYNPDNFDATTRSIMQRLKDKGLKEIGEGEKQQIVKAAEKFFEERAKEQFNAVKGIIPRAKQAEMQGMGEGSVIRAFPKELSNQQVDLGQAGLKKL